MRLAEGEGFVQNPKSHGLRLDSQHRLQVLEEDGWAVIKLIKRERAPGGPDTTYVPNVEEEGPAIRFGAERVLAMVRSEVLHPAPPNYLNNPGQRYRVSVKGVEVAPDYQRIFEVDAADALDGVFNEIIKIYNVAHGVEREALYLGGVLAARALNKAGRLPAEIPSTVLQSKSGQYRIRGPAMNLAKQGHIKRFGPVHQGRHYSRVIADDPELTVTDVSGARRPTTERARPDILERATPYLERQYRAGKELKPEKHRANMLTDFSSDQMKRKLPGRHTKPLTVPEEDYPALGRAQRESMEMTMGPSMSAMEARVEGRPPIPIRRATPRD